MNIKRVAIPLANTLEDEALHACDTLTSDLSAMGIDTKLEKTESGLFMSFEYDPIAYKRNAGRKEKPIPENCKLASMDQPQRDEWFLSSSIEDIMEELDIGRSTAFRRKAEARRRVEYYVVKIDEE